MPALTRDLSSSIRPLRRRCDINVLILGPFFFFFFQLFLMTSTAAISAAGAGSSSSSSASFSENFAVSWAPSNVRFSTSGGELQLVLDETTGSGFASKQSYLFGNIDMQIKLVPGDSAGTVTAYYLSSETSNHDELDFEFLGNSSGHPYVLQTNVFSNGVGGREQRIYLWFDPTKDFHTYSISWNKQRILFLVDGVPIRGFVNSEAAGVPYLKQQPLRVFSSIWNGDSWATQGGRVKINWAYAPFVASYRNFQARACIASPSSPASISACASSPMAVSSTGGPGASLTATSTGSSTKSAALINNRLAWLKRKLMVYDYCSDHARYPVPPPECTRPLF